MSKGKYRGDVFPYVTIRLNQSSRIADLECEKYAVHEAIEIKYFYAGSSTLIVANETITVKAGDVVVVNPYEFHATIANGEQEGRYHLLIVPLEYFSGEMVDDLNLKQMILEKRLNFLPCVEATGIMKQCVLRIVDEHTKKPPYHHMVIRSQLLELFGLLLRENAIRRSETDVALLKKESFRTIDPALRHIRDNYANPISLDELAALCNLSKHYFCHIFRNVIGRTAMEYLREYRMKVAYVMLENTTKSVSQIAEECGFVDSNYFTRCFKQHYGISPLKHREYVRINANLGESVKADGDRQYTVKERRDYDH